MYLLFQEESVLLRQKSRTGKKNGNLKKIKNILYFICNLIKNIFLYDFNMNMTPELICSLSSCSLYKEDENHYSLQYTTGCFDFLRSIAAVIGDENCNLPNNRKIVFRAQKVQPLEFYLLECESMSETGGVPMGRGMSYQPCLWFLYNLYNQNEYLMNEDMSIFCMRIKDILVINNSIFVFINCKNVANIDIHTDTISFTTPFSRFGFCAPEIMAVSALPAIVDSRCFLYSLAALLVFCITRVNICELTTENTRIVENLGVYSVILPHLKTLVGTKLHWCILRMLKVVPRKRRFLYL